MEYLRIHADASKFAEVLDARSKFKAGANLSGRPGEFTYMDTGRLDSQWVDSARSADYIVISHATPIAWHVPGTGWIVPAKGTLGDDAESVTTTRYMNKIRAALSKLGTYAETL